MQIIYGVNVPVQVSLNGRMYNGNKRMDVVVEGEVLVVFAPRPSEKLGRNSCSARVQDVYTGEIITIQAFNEMAYHLSKLQVGETISAYGTVGRFKGKQYFTVSEFVDFTPVVYSDRTEARNARSESAPDPVENEQVSSFQPLELDEVAAVS